MTMGPVIMPMVIMPMVAMPVMVMPVMMSQLMGMAAVAAKAEPVEYLCQHGALRGSG